jgi:TIR domain
MSRHVFISHSEKDKASAELLLNALENRGVRCWIAPRDVPPGGSYAEAILTAIENSTCFVLVYTEHCNVSSHVLREVERALKFGLNIIPVRFDDSAPSKGLDYLLATVQWLSVTNASIDGDVVRAAEQISSCVLPGGDAEPPLATSLAPAAATRAQKPAPANGATKRKRSIVPLSLSILLLLALVALGAVVFKNLSRISPSVPNAPSPAAKQSSSPTMAPSEATNVEKSESPEATLHQYFDALNRRDRQAAYNLLSTRFKKRLSYKKYLQSFSSTFNLQLIEANVVDRTKNSATALVKFDEVDSAFRRERWQGPIVLVSEPDGWRIDTMHELRRANVR